QRKRLSAGGRAKHVAYFLFRHHLSFAVRDKSYRTLARNGAPHRWRTGVISGGTRHFTRPKRRKRLEKTSTYLSSHPSHAGGHRFESCRAHHSFSRASACSNLRPCPPPRLRLTDPVVSDLNLQFVGILRNTKPKPGSNSRRPPLAIYACANQLTPCLCRQFVDNRV